MRILGAAAIGVGVIAFILWLISWIYWNLLENMGETVTYVIRGVSAGSVVLEFLAILLVAIGLVVGGGRRTAV
jgi:hypothetical protein